MVTRKILDELFAEFGLFGADVGSGAMYGADGAYGEEIVEEERSASVDPARFTDADVERFMAAVYRNQS